MNDRRRTLTLTGLAIAVATLTAAGIGVRATYGAQTTADEPQYLLSALSLWEDGNLDISDELRSERYRSFHRADLPQQTRVLDDGSQISPHDPLLPLLLALPVGLGGWVGAKAAMAAMAGLLAALVAWIAMERFKVSPRLSVVIALVFALAPPLAIYATQVYPEVPAALALLAGFAAVLGTFERKGRVVFTLSVIALPWLAVKYAPLATVLALAGLVKAWRRRPIGLLVTFALAGVIYAVGHLAIYGELTAYATGDHFTEGQLTVIGTDVNLAGRATRLIGLLVDRGFGLGAWQPAFLLAPLVVGWSATRHGPGNRLALALIGTGWLVATFAALTMHGWWFPGRQVVVLIPLIAVLVAAWAAQATPALRRAVVALAVLGPVAFGYLLAEGLGGGLTWVVDFGATSNPFYRGGSAVLPDYMTPTTATWVLHGLWICVAAALAIWGARSIPTMTSSWMSSLEIQPTSERPSGAGQSASTSRSSASSSATA